MALFTKEKGPVVAPGKIENVLGASTRFEGRVTSDGNIRVDGVLEGSIETTGNVIIGEHARVMAEAGDPVLRARVGRHQGGGAPDR